MELWHAVSLKETEYMTKTNCLGIWMDHASAHLIEFTTDPIETRTIESAFTPDRSQDTSSLKGEKSMHNKEQDEDWAFYRKLSAVIEKYTEVLLFGPTDAKKELFNILKSNNAFENIRIDMKQTDKMSVNQEHAFVKDFFSKK